MSMNNLKNELKEKLQKMESKLLETNYDKKLLKNYYKTKSAYLFVLNMINEA